ncbi:hypothetical protein GUB04_15345 [Escherichia coli]|nr:hypothetical protein [Escherichia coli]
MRAARVASSRTEDTDLQDDSHIDKHYKVVLEQFRGFLRSLMMHAGVGTALGGVMTMVGEPQNLIIAKAAGWHFGDFFLRMSPVTVPVLICGLLTCLLVEKLRWFGYGETLPEKVREVLQQFDDQSRHQRTRQDKIRLIVQAIIGVWLVTALALHLAEVGLIGLSVIILATSLTGVTDEHAIGKAFTESLPFTALLTVFFSVVAVIIDQQLFSPIIQFVLQASEHAQLSLFYIFNGLLSSISDNVFVGTIYINEAKAAMESGAITLKQYEQLAVAINTGTNLPSVATPNGQAAFLFLLTSALAPLIRLSYGRMVWMALPYTLVLTLVGLLCVEFTLTALLTVFFSVVAVIIDQQLFSPIIQFVLQASEHAQLSLFYIFNGLLSSISDNVFVGTIYINEAKAAMESGAITLKQYELLAVAINTGTNLPSVATPNGQAAFLFLLTSALAPLIRLSYGRMVWMALPYTLVLTLVGLLCVEFTLAPVTEWFMQMGWIATL